MGEWVMRVAPEIYRYEVPERHTHSAQLAVIEKRAAGTGRRERPSAEASL
jgi:hypothetical protein